mmetsp:Transcript_37376/g.73042  ORF Transcript_37376/g.73042 Transcript_37376/m.73042 type:complete len:125 (+) Transcript_37376:87-461(+)|eukprot:CAMPEP_0173391996 /NCGR_PEP_ID=MMETSP1356-20130122/18702_1 /TAXON_ID=77927 ORGANISM="Hemiselmis virescens, Strain PCC157" /NCGR_SAMPLE_ID=MMETSP1356 /ASSEMBLY_ACC=CAM_ASM_000847 /LENGTH=124 /DNA_ID=CAMNT_0014349705 /DNA_START=71 /DNA_END=445 /DNA_ORIENTATION=+
MNMEDCPTGECAIGEASAPKTVDGRSSNESPEEEGDTSTLPVIVYHRHTCGLCWIARYRLWSEGIPFELKPLDSDDSWGEALYSNGYKGGTFKLPVITHGRKAWWNISNHTALAKEIKGRVFPA